LNVNIGEQMKHNYVMISIWNITAKEHQH
jgi:hypothetical protein